MSLGRRAYNLLRGYLGREFDRIEAIDRVDALEELAEPGATPPATQEQRRSERLTAERARELLGVAPDADFETVRRTYERLFKRSDPSNFPEGSPERERARQIHQKVGEAYAALLEELPALEKRFRSLDID